MTTKKFAVSFPGELHERARQAAQGAGMSLSAWLSRAAEHELAATIRRADGLAAIAEFEAEQGAVTPSADDRAWVADVLASAAPDQRVAG